MAQPKIEGLKQGKPVMPYGSDGSDWIALLVSSLGALQVELASLPTGAVTIADGSDVTLGALADAIVTAGATGSVSAKLRRLTTDLDALLTELKLKANLLDTQPISVASLPLPSLASTSTLQGTIITALQSIQNLVGALGAVDLDRLRVESKDGDKIFSFESIVEGVLGTGDLATGLNVFDSTPIDSNKIWEINLVSMSYDGTVPTYIVAVAMGLAGNTTVMFKKSPTSGDIYIWSGVMRMQVGDYIRFEIDGATLHDNAYLHYAGVQMNAP